MSRGVEKTALQAASLFGLILCVLTAARHRAGTPAASASM